MQLDNKGRLNMWTDINITDKYRDLEIDANKLFDHGILTEEYDKLRQTLPDDYLDGIAPNTAMSLAGNGWTVDVIAHLLRFIDRNLTGSSEMDTNVACDKDEQDETIRESQDS